MRLGLITNSLTGIGITDLKEIADLAAANGIQELEVGPAIALERQSFEDILAEGKIAIRTLIYCRNFLSEDAAEASRHQEALKQRIEFASELGIEKVVCSTGVTRKSFEGMGFRPENSLDECVELFKGFLELAERKNVRLCFENCPMMGNIAVAPDICEMLFDRLDSERIGLCYDPSHLVWQMIDPYSTIFRFRNKIFHVHGKDTQVDTARRNQSGVLQNSKWWRHRLPGLGDLDWRRIVDSLYEIGYSGAVSIEHEDPVWEGSEAKVKSGILKARDTIVQYFI